MLKSDLKPYDLVVIGGGPAGATAAALVARRGHRVLLLEQDQGRRHKVGESLYPCTIHGVLELSGAKDRVLQEKFVKKKGGLFFWQSADKPWLFSFQNSDNMPDYAVQVVRSKFEQLLIENAEQSGANVRLGTRVERVWTQDNGTMVCELTNMARVRTKFIVDASGTRSNLANAMCGERVPISSLRNSAIYCYMEGVQRLPGDFAGYTITASIPSGWAWMIPLSENMTSVGVVQQRPALANGSLEKILRQSLNESPTVSQMVKTAKLTSFGGKEIHFAHDWSYCRPRFRQDNYLCAGDSACFIDPFFSTGIHLSTLGALWAARAINSSLQDPAQRDHYLSGFENSYKREFSEFLCFVFSFYQKNKASGPFWSKFDEAHIDTSLINLRKSVEGCQDSLNLKNVRKFDPIFDSQDSDIAQTAKQQLMLSVMQQGAFRPPTKDGPQLSGDKLGYDSHTIR